MHLHTVLANEVEDRKASNANTSASTVFTLIEM